MIECNNQAGLKKMLACCHAYLKLVGPVGSEKKNTLPGCPDMLAYVFDCF